MKMVFADTSFYVALMSLGDRHHDLALEFLRHDERQVITTDFVIIEVGNFFRRPKDRPYFLSLHDGIADDERTTIVEASREWRDRGIELYRRRHDKLWSLTDCISFNVMQDHGVVEALTADHHFAQAGFVPLLA